VLAVGDPKVSELISVLHSNKVVADGAISGVLDRPVSSRVTRSAFGVNCCTVYDPAAPEHVRRKWQCIDMASGETAIPDMFSVILERVLLVHFYFDPVTNV
jgi:hypothetical protein